MESVDVSSLELDPRLAADEAGVGAAPAGRLSRFARPMLIAGLGMILIAILVAIFAPFIVRHDPTALSVNLLSPPSSTNLFGTDELGRDLFSRVIYASRVSLSVAFG